MLPQCSTLLPINSPLMALNSWLCHWLSCLLLCAGAGCLPFPVFSCGMPQVWKRAQAPLESQTGGKWWQWKMRGHIFCTLILQKLECLEVVLKWPLTDEVIQLHLKASVGGFLKSCMLSHRNFMSQSLKKVSHQDSPSASDGILQEFSL